MTTASTLRRWLQPYLLALAVVAVSLALRVVVLADLGRSTPYVTFYPALMFAAVIGGWRVGLFSTVVVAWLSYAWTQAGSLNPAEATALGMFLISGGIISVMGELMHRSRTRNERARSEALRQSEELQVANARLQDEVVERRRTEAELRRTEDLMELATTAADITVFTQDRALRYTWIFNPQIGFKASEVIGRTDAALLPADDAAALEALKRRVLEEGIPLREEVRISQPDRNRSFLLHAKPLRNADGVITGLTGLTLDITTLRDADRLRHESDARYRSIFENSHTVMLLIEPADGSMVDANPAAEAFYGWTRDELRGKKITEINLLPAVELRSKMEEARTAESGRFVFQHRLADGSIRDVEVFSGPISQQGRPLLLSFVYDITARKAAEAQAKEAQANAALLLAEGRLARLALLSVVEDERQSQEALLASQESIRQLNLELEQRIRERTADLEAANLELEAFNYSVSHDLRAPLRAIDGFARILEEDFGPLLGDEGRRVLGIIVSEERRMETLVNDLLRLSRLGRQALDPQPLDLRGLAEAVGEQLVAQAGNRVVHLKIEEMPVAWADAGLMRQVLTNLIDNALKFTGQRPEAEIVVGGRQEGDENIYFVADNGVGFDMGRIERLFGVFQRLHSEAEFKGTGIGLALVKRIVQRHGGRVWAESRVGKGAKFYFALPVSLAPMEEPAPLRPSASPFPVAPGD